MTIFERKTVSTFAHLTSLVANIFSPFVKYGLEGLESLT